MSSISVKLEAFDGPLDLLLHLIEKNKIDIFDIPIAEITRQYMDIISKTETADMDIMSDFLVMAATLLKIKSKMLLPVQVDEKGEEVDPREELVNRLLEYQTYKNITSLLQEKELLRKDIYTKSPENIKNYIDERTEIHADVTLDDLLAAFQRYYQRKIDNKPLSTKVTVNEISVSSRRHDIKNILKTKRRVSFFELFPIVSKEYVVATFLAILEMCKNNEITIIQNDTFDDIVCEVKDHE